MSLCLKRAMTQPLEKSCSINKQKSTKHWLSRRVLTCTWFAAGVNSSLLDRQREVFLPYQCHILSAFRQSHCQLRQHLLLLQHKYEFSVNTKWYVCWLLFFIWFVTRNYSHPLRSRSEAGKGLAYLIVTDNPHPLQCHQPASREKKGSERLQSFLFVFFMCMSE